MSREYAGKEELVEDGRFIAAIDHCRRRLAEGESLDHLLTEYPTGWREELSRFVPLATRLESLRADPEPSFAMALERRLLDEARVERREAEALRRRGSGWLSRLLPRLSTAGITAIIVVLLAGLGGGVGLSRASASSLPDSPLYGLKRAGEWAQLSIASTPEQRIEVQAEQLTERSRELVQVARAVKDGAGAQRLVDRIDAAAGRMVDQALEARATGNQRPAVRAYAALRLLERRTAVAVRQVQPAARPALLSLEKSLKAQEQRLLDAGIAPLPPSLEPDDA